MANEEQKNVSSIITDALRAKGISLEKLAQLTGVSDRHLTMFLNEKFETLPPAPYTHGYLMRVSNALNLDGPQIWADYLKDNEALRRSGEKDHLPKNRFETRVFKKRLLLPILLVLFILAYTIFGVMSFYNKPKFSLNIKDGVILHDPKLSLLGSIGPTDQLTLNGEVVYSDEKGNFQNFLELKPGFNTLVFKIKRILGKEFMITKQVFYEVPTEAATLKNQ